MKVAIIGTGNIGGRLADRLAHHGVDVVVATSSVEKAEQVAERIGHGVTAASREDAIDAADIVVFSTWFDTTRQLLGDLGELLLGKVVVDASNNIAFDDAGNAQSRNPEGVSAGQQLAPLVPQGAGYVKAFGTMAAEQLEEETTADGQKVTLFYAADDFIAGRQVAELIRLGGWDAVEVGGVDATGRIEVFGDLHPFGGLQGRLLGKDEAASLV